MQTEVLCLLGFLGFASGHGRLVEPPSRSSMWRYGFQAPPNYNDHELFCGGVGVQWSTNGGKCGVCGDPYNAPQPRPNEAGGKYGNGIIVRTYRKGQVIKASVELTANHEGYFEFRICPHNDPKTIVSQECLDKHPLYLEDRSSRLIVQPHYIGFVNTTLKLPDGMACTQCVLQWQYIGGNNWGRCPNGTAGLGCGPQETFRACSDVAVLDKDATHFPPTSTRETTISVTMGTRKSTRKTTTRRTVATTSSSLTTSKPGGNKFNCKAVPLNRIPGMDFWCKTNCAMGHCPPDLCVC